jgi:hypothetical protein
MPTFHPDVAMLNSKKAKMRGRMFIKRAFSAFFVFCFSSLPLFSRNPMATADSASVLRPVQAGRYFSIYKRTAAEGDVMEVIINGPPDPPVGITRELADGALPMDQAGLVTFSEVPAFNWSFGCSPTSAAMIAGYYDRRGYSNMYTGPTNGGVMPLNNSSWPDWVDSSKTARHQCPLSATHNGLDGRIVRGHVDDYWIYYLQPGPDPFVTNGWTEHTYGECTADYMKTNQWSYTNRDGSTSFYFYPTGEAYAGADAKDGGYGLQLFFESRGYTVVNRHSRILLGYDWDGSGTKYTPAIQGAVFADYKTEIDAGRPVLIHLEGHTMAGVGYDDNGGADSLVYVHDTWDYGTHTMTWGGSYGGMKQMGVTVIGLAEAEIDIRGNGHSIPDGDTTPSATDGTDFGTVNVGDEATHLFTIHNTGAYDLYLTGSPNVQISGSTDFAVISQPSGDPATFSVLFRPSGTGSQTATITVPNTDLNENPYDFTLQGNGGDVYVIARIKAFLAGPYQAGGSMTTALKTAGSIPTTSPYADGRTVSIVPDGVTDWISVELRSSATGPSVAQKSFFLKSDGSVVDTDGSAADLPIPGVAAGSYFILVFHRNHLAVMSAAAQPLDSSSPSTYDFSAGTEKYYGSAAQLLESGVYGMVAGDANASGTVDAADRSSAWNNRNLTGYRAADCNLSGTVDAADRSIAWNNRNKTTSVP